MEELLKFAPLINLVILIVTGAVFILRLNEAITRFQRGIDDINKQLFTLSERVTKQETICLIRHEQETSS